MKNHKNEFWSWFYTLNIIYFPYFFLIIFLECHTFSKFVAEWTHTHTHSTYRFLKWNDGFIFVCMHSGCVSLASSTHIHMHVEAKVWYCISNIITSISIFYQWFLIYTGLLPLFRQWIPSILQSPPPQHWDYAAHHHVLLVHKCRRSKLRSWLFQ